MRNPEFANSKRLPKVSSLVRNKREQQRETIVKGRMFSSLLLLTFHIFFSINNFKTQHIYLPLKYIARIEFVIRCMNDLSTVFFFPFFL